MSLLTANLGNSRFSLAWFEGEKLLDHAAFALTEDPRRALDSFLKKRHPRQAMFCSVNPPAEESLLAPLRGCADRVRRVGVDVKVPMSNLCREPERVGQDRLVVAFEAWHRAKSACLALDAGTAMTLSAVGTKGEFLGGAIAPGFGLAAKALAQHTAQLPQVGNFAMASILGRSTEEAIAAGIGIGWVGMAQAWIEASRRELGEPLRVFATGGDLERLRSAKSIDEFRPHLLHEGLARLAALSDAATQTS